MGATGYVFREGTERLRSRAWADKEDTAQGNVGKDMERQKGLGHAKPWETGSDRQCGSDRGAQAASEGSSTPGPSRSGDEDTWGVLSASISVSLPLGISTQLDPPRTCRDIHVTQSTPRLSIDTRTRVSLIVSRCVGFHLETS